MSGADALGVIAGAGGLPGAILASAEQAGRPTYVAAIRGFCDESTVAGRRHDWFDLAAVGALVEGLRKAGCGEVTMAGRIDRPDFARLRPDWQGVKLLPRLVRAAARGDDALLRTLVAYLEEQGFRYVGADAAAGDLVAPEGVLGRHAPDADDRADIDLALRVVRALGELDVGQGAVVRRGLTLAVEAAEGTDAMLARVAGLNADGGGVLVKRVKPGQERRVDLPTIGVATIEQAAAAGLRGVAVEAGGALIVDRAATIAAADAAGLFLVGVRP